LVVLLCLFLSGLAQGIGLASLLPTVSMALGDTAGEQSSSVVKVTEWLAFFGIEANIVTLVTLGVSTVILKNIPDYALMAGVPGKQIGWVSEYGEKLDLPLIGNAQALCKYTNQKYQLKDDKVNRVT